MIYLMLADGFEEVEAMAPVDVLRRAGADLKTVGVTGRMVTGAHGVPMQADCTPEEVDLAAADMVILPGGMPGTKNLYASAFVRDAIQYCIDHDKYVAAICAAPSVVLGGMGLLQGKEATCYPGMEDGMAGANAQPKPYCIAGKIITGRAAGAAFDFALALCAVLKGEAVAEQVRRDIVYVG